MRIKIVQNDSGEQLLILNVDGKETCAEVELKEVKVENESLVGRQYINLKFLVTDFRLTGHRSVTIQSKEYSDA